MNVLAFDVGGTSIKYGLVSDTLEIISKDKFATPENEEKLIDLFSKIIEDNLSDISKVSVAMPGYVNTANNKYSNLIMLTFGTGVGGGIISEDKLLRGKGNAGEIGHMLTSNDREVEGDNGKKGSFESSVAASVWTKKCLELTKENQDSELAKIFAIKNFGSVLFDNSLSLTNAETAVRDEVIQNISNGLLSLFEIFDNEAFVLGGSMSSEPYDLIELIQSDIKNRYKFPSRKFPEIFIASQGEDSGIIGAAILALNE